jgi:hypothetical protein
MIHRAPHDRLPRFADERKHASRRRRRLLAVTLAAVVFPVVAAVLRFAPPTESSFYPRCVFKMATGLYCPGCGAARCLHSLLNGRYAQAFAYNPVLVVALPFLAVAMVRELYSAWMGRDFIRQRLPRWAILLIFWFLLAFWVARNIDFYPFSLLAPRELALE